MSHSNSNNNNKSNNSLLLNQTNLAWSQPTGFSLAAPSPSINQSEQQQQKQQSVATNQDNQSTMTNNQSQCDTKNDNTIHHSTNNETSLAESLVNFVHDNQSTNTSQASTPTNESMRYKEVDYHWFYQKNPENNPDDWQAFSMFDSYQLEAAFQQNRLDDLIPTNGTRYDVRIKDRLRWPVYWQGSTSSVSRCSWFYKREADFKFVPYPEYIALVLENTYRECFTTNQWNHRVDLNDQEFFVFYSHDSVYHYFNDAVVQSPSSSGWSTLTASDPATQPRYCYRGPWLIQLQPERDELSSSVRHLLFFVHGIGEFCDLSFRRLKEVVDDFRTITQELLLTHYGAENGRVEVLPITWHQALHTNTLDNRLREITLPSIQKLRSFTNDTILDALFYTSPKHSNFVLNYVASELNRLHKLFLQRNTYFNGKICLAGHSLGSLILFDLLSYQIPKNIVKSDQNAAQQQSNINFTSDNIYNNNQMQQLDFEPECLFALGSPLSAFLTIRGIELSADFHLPTCPGFFNIYHPYDPIAYRFEPLINREFSKIKAQLVPHHKGRKRIHLELKDSLQRVGTDLKQKFLSGIRGAWDSIYGFAKAHVEDQQQEQQLSITTETTADLNETQQQQSMIDQQTSTSISNSLSESAIDSNMNEQQLQRILSMNFGRLNRGRRIDYVLQERPFEIVNEYVFAITSHVYYWFSEDTALLMLRELFEPQSDQSTLQSNESHKQVSSA